MDYLWSPWRFKYIASGHKETGCVFCIAGNSQRENQDPESLVLFRGDKNFVILNLFPYTSGHLMVAPYIHSASLSEIAGATTVEMMELVARAHSALESVYNPDGFNIGINLGEAAGAGVRDHIHLHVVPRWFGDANFMSIIGETRVLPEDLQTTYQKLKKHFQ